MEIPLETLDNVDEIFLKNCQMESFDVRLYRLFYSSYSMLFENCSISLKSLSKTRSKEPEPSINTLALENCELLGNCCKKFLFDGFNIDKLIIKNTEFQYPSIDKYFIPLTSNLKEVGYEKIRTIDFSHNKISKISSDTFKNLHYLAYLDLSNNEISSLDESLFEERINVRKLDLNSNIIKGLPRKIFRGMISLEELDLSHNLLKNLADSCDFLKYLPNSLETLKLNNNQISSIDVYHLPDRIREINLEDNRLENVSCKDYKQLTYLKYLRLSRNPIRNPSQFRCLRYVSVYI